MGCIFKTAPAADSRNLRDHDWSTGPLAQGWGFPSQKPDSDSWTRHPSLGHGDRRKQRRLRHGPAFSRRLNGHNFGLSAVEWSPFRPVRSRCVQLRFGLQNSSVFWCKTRASSYPYPRGEILHTFGRKRMQNIEAQGGLCGTEPAVVLPPDQCLDTRNLAPACYSSQPR